MKNIHLIDSKNKDFSIEDYYPSLDGLRGLAILLIILYHNFWFLAISRFAWIGVDLFFVLSGFLITGILLKKRDSRFFLRNFYARRALRILPVYYLSLVAFLFILPHMVSYPFGLHYFIVNQPSFWLEIQNWLFILKPRGNNNFLNHFWSIALEEQFYFLSPWIILLLKPPQKIISFLLIMLLLVLFLRLLTWSRQFTDISYIELYAFTRIDGLCVGSLLAIFRYHGIYKVKKLNKLLLFLFLSLISIALPFLKIYYQSSLPYVACCLYPGIAIFWGWIVWSSINPGNFMFRIFNTRVLIFFGKISYGLYIFHWPIYQLLKANPIMTSAKNHLFEPGMSLAIFSATAAIILATISYYTYERYFLGLKKYFV